MNGILIDHRTAFSYSRAIVQNDDLDPDTPWSNLVTNDFWGVPITHSGSHKSYRPVCTLTFRVNRFVGGLRPWSYHLTNIGLHALVTYLLVVLTRQVVGRKDRLTPLLTGLLFGLHPIHTEAVAGVVGRADLLCGVFFLLSLLSYQEHVKTGDQGLRSSFAGDYLSKCDSNGNNHVLPQRQRSEGLSSLSSSTIKKCHKRHDNGHCNGWKEMTTASASSLANNHQEPWDGSRLNWFVWWRCFSKTAVPENHLPTSQCYDHSKPHDHTVKSSLDGLYHQQLDRNGNNQALPKLPKSGGLGSPDIKSHLSWWMMLAITFSGLAMFSKEQGITVLGVCIVMELVRCRKPSRTFRWLLCAATALVAFRVQIIGFKTPSFAKADNPTSSSPEFLTRLLTFTYLPAFNLYMLFNPSTLSFDWSMDSVPLIRSLCDLRNLLTLTTGILMALVSFKCLIKPSRSSGVILSSLAMMVIPFLPAMNLFFYVGFVVAERVLYIPSMGFCLLTALCVNKAIAKATSKALKAKVAFFAFLVLVTFSAKTIRRNQDWKSEESLYRSGLAVNPPKGTSSIIDITKNKVFMAFEACQKTGFIFMQKFQ